MNDFNFIIGEIQFIFHFPIPLSQKSFKKKIFFNILITYMYIIPLFDLKEKFKISFMRKSNNLVYIKH